MNNKVEFIENVCEIHLKEVEILVKVPYEGELTDCWATAVYDENGMRSLQVKTYDEYDEIYLDNQFGTMTKQIDSEYVEQIEKLLNEQL